MGVDPTVMQNWVTDAEVIRDGPLVGGAFSVIVKTDCETNGSFVALV